MWKGVFLKQGNNNSKKKLTWPLPCWGPSVSQVFNQACRGVSFVQGLDKDEELAELEMREEEECVEDLRAFLYTFQDWNLCFVFLAMTAKVAKHSENEKYKWWLQYNCSSDSSILLLYHLLACSLSVTYLNTELFIRHSETTLCISETFHLLSHNLQICGL